MSFEINREVLNEDLDKMSLFQVLETLDRFYNNEKDYLKELCKPGYSLEKEEGKKFLRNRFKFFRAMRVEVEEYLVTTYGISGPEKPLETEEAS